MIINTKQIMHHQDLYRRPLLEPTWRGKCKDPVLPLPFLLIRLNSSIPILFPASPISLTSINMPSVLANLLKSFFYRTGVVFHLDYLLYPAVMEYKVSRTHLWRDWIQNGGQCRWHIFGVKAGIRIRCMRTSGVATLRKNQSSTWKELDSAFSQKM